MPKFNINKEYNVTRCLDCPHYQNTMDGMTCNEAERLHGAYGGLIINDKMKVSPKCPYLNIKK